MNVCPGDGHLYLGVCMSVTSSGLSVHLTVSVPNLHPGRALAGGTVLRSLTCALCAEQWVRAPTSPPDQLRPGPNVQLLLFGRVICPIMEP